MDYMKKLENWGEGWIDGVKKAAELFDLKATLLERKGRISMGELCEFQFNLLDITSELKRRIPLPSDDVQDSFYWAGYLAGMKAYADKVRATNGRLAENLELIGL